MPMYTYRRDDGTTFDVRQKFSDDPLTVDPTTGQRVVRIVQPAGIIFKGSGFYVNDSRNASHSTINGSNGKPAKEGAENSSASSEKSDKTPTAKEAPRKKEPSVSNTTAD